MQQKLAEKAPWMSLKDSQMKGTTFINSNFWNPLKYIIVLNFI